MKRGVFMKSVYARLLGVKKILSLALVMSLIITTISSSFTLGFAQEDLQSGRFLVVYEQGNNENLKPLRGKASGSDDKKISGAELISEGKQNIALIEDSAAGIKFSLRNENILAIEEDKKVSLLSATTSTSIFIDDDNPLEDISGKNENEILDEKTDSTSDTQNDDTQNIDSKPLDNAQDKSDNTNDKTDDITNENNRIKTTLDKYIIESKGDLVKIALIDSGVNTHISSGRAIELAGGKSFIDSSYDKDENGHGTALASIIKGYELADGTKFEGLAKMHSFILLKF